MKAQDRQRLLRSLQTRFEHHRHRHPDVVDLDRVDGRCTFRDCAPENPAGRRGLCFDADALAARKARRPVGSAVERAAAMGIELLNEQPYRELQAFGDKRYRTVFAHDNDAQSCYTARGFRGLCRV